jgi:hypothetical protein
MKDFADDNPHERGKASREPGRQDALGRTRREPAHHSPSLKLRFPEFDNLLKRFARNKAAIVLSTFWRRSEHRANRAVDGLGARLQRDAGWPETEIARLAAEAQRRWRAAQAQMRWA